MDEEGQSDVRTPPEGRLPSYPMQRLTSLEVVLMAGGIVVFLVMLYTMARGPSANSFLNPPLMAAAVAILVWPLRHTAAARALFLATGLLLGLWALKVLSGILAPFVIVYLLAFLFDPLVTRARERFGVPRFVTSLAVTVLFVGALAFVILLMVPQLFGELEDLAVRILGSVTYIREWVATTTLLDDLEAAGLVDKETLIRDITTTLQQSVGGIADSIPALAESLIGYITSLFGIITILAIVPVILYYTLKDYPWIKRRLVELFPTFGGQHDYLVQAGGVVGSYLRGQLTISGIAAFNVSIVLSLFNVPYALIIGLLAGVLNLIPNLGAIITNIIAVLMMLVFGRDPWYRDVIIVLGVLGAQGLLEQSVLTPKILSHSVGLHPVLIILSLFVFAHFLGWFGLIIAVPTTALIMTYYKSRRDGWSFELGSSPPAPARPPLAWRRRFSFRRGGQPSGEGGSAGEETRPGDGDAS